VSKNCKQFINVHFTNFCIGAIIVIMSLLIGWKAFLLIQFPILVMYSTCGVWMFYVQHQFEDVYWEETKDWDYAKVALEGSSYYQLPRILHWFTGNIGYHHIHHLSPKIPNYLLRQCHESHQMFRDALDLTRLPDADVESHLEQTRRKRIFFFFLLFQFLDRALPIHRNLVRLVIAVRNERYLPM